MGYLAKNAHGLVLTPIGRVRLSDFVEQTVDIVIGLRVAYDETTEHCFRERNALFYKRNKFPPPPSFHFAPKLRLEAERMIVRKIPQHP